MYGKHLILDAYGFTGMVEYAGANLESALDNLDSVHSWLSLLPKLVGSDSTSQPTVTRFHRPGCFGGVTGTLALDGGYAHIIAYPFDSADMAEDGAEAPTNHTGICFLDVFVSQGFDHDAVIESFAAAFGAESIDIGYRGRGKFFAPDRVQVLREEDVPRIVLPDSPAFFDKRV